MVIIKHSFPIIPIMVAWLLILLGNHGTKGTNHILHNVSACAFFRCIFLTNNLYPEERQKNTDDMRLIY